MGFMCSSVTGAAKTSFTGPTLPSVTHMVQTFSWLFDLHDHPLTRQRIFTVNR